MTRQSTPSYWLDSKKKDKSFIESKGHKKEGERTLNKIGEFWYRASLPVEKTTW